MIREIWVMTTSKGQVQSSEKEVKCWFDSDDKKVRSNYDIIIIVLLISGSQPFSARVSPKRIKNLSTP